MGEMDHIMLRRRIPVMEREVHWGSHKETISPKQLSEKRRGADFCEVFFSTRGLKDWKLEVREVAGIEP